MRWPESLRSLPFLAFVTFRRGFHPDRGNPGRNSPLFRLATDLASVAACWLCASGAAITLAERDPGLRLFLRYAGRLPAILYFWTAASCLVGLYRPRRLWSRLSEATVATTVSIFSGGVVFAVLMFADRHHSRRTLILALVTFWVATTVLFALSRTVLGPAIELAGCHLSDRLRAAYLVGVFGDAMLRHVQQLASVLARLIPQVRRPSHSAIASWGLGVLMFNLFWFSSFLSFPLVGEDGAANYSFLVETVQNASPWQLIFPIKWLEGLGQPNVFVTVTFDPFSWLMFSGLDAPDAFRISYALRASVCWVFTYLFVSELFRRARGIALT